MRALDGACPERVASGDAGEAASSASPSGAENGLMSPIPRERNRTMSSKQAEPQDTAAHTTHHTRGGLESAVAISIDRRSFLARTGGGAAAIATGGAVSLPIFETEASELGTGGERAKQAANIKRDAATAEQRLPIPAHPDNGDEARYPNKIGNYSKCLKHNPVTGEVDPAAYSALVSAINSGNPNDFEAVVTNGHFGNPDPATQRRLVNPQSAYAFDL